MTPPPQLDEQVRHKSGALKVGIVTAILTRTNGVQYGVTWDDLTERYHAASELESFPADSKSMGMPTTHAQ